MFDRKTATPSSPPSPPSEEAYSAIKLAYEETVKFHTEWPERRIGNLSLYPLPEERSAFEEAVTSHNKALDLARPWLLATTTTNAEALHG